VVRLSVTKRDIRASGSTGWRIRRGQTSYSPREIGGLAIKPANSKTFYPDEEVLGNGENFDPEHEMQMKSPRCFSQALEKLQRRFFTDL
jgi:hypothetical protein